MAVDSHLVPQTAVHMTNLFNTLTQVWWDRLYYHFVKSLTRKTHCAFILMRVASLGIARGAESSQNTHYNPCTTQTQHVTLHYTTQFNISGTGHSTEEYTHFTS